MHDPVSWVNIQAEMYPATRLAKKSIPTADLQLYIFAKSLPTLPALGDTKPTCWARYERILHHYLIPVHSTQLPHLIRSLTARHISP